MSYLLILIALAISYCIFTNKGIKRIFWYLTGILLVSSQVIIVSSPFIDSHRLFTLVFLLATLKDYQQLKNSYRTFPNKLIFIVFILGCVAIGLHDDRLSFVQMGTKIFFNIVSTFFILLLVHQAMVNSNQFNGILADKIRFVAFVITLYGIFIFATQTNPIDRLITEAFNVPSNYSKYTEGSRFRINAFNGHPISYGYICGLLALYYFYITNVIKKKLKFNYILIALLLINMLMTSSRTPIISTIIGFAVYLALGMNLKTKLRYFFFFIFCLLIAYQTIPFVRDVSDSVIDIAITGGNNTSGSSFDMREEQLVASMGVLSQNPIFGNGYDYIETDMGWGNNDNRTYNSELRGFESYLFVLLIEQGLIGIVIHVLMNLSMLLYFVKRLKINRKLSALGISMTLMFNSFIFATGVLGTWNITMVFLGLCISAIEIDKASYINSNLKTYQ